MSDSPYPENDFLRQVTEVIEENLADEKFGVSELARAMGRSRSSLLRRVKKEAGISVSQLIRQVRLDQGMKLLKDPDLTVSEVAYRVGFKSTSYFIKCFREHYGYPPGEAENRHFDESEAPSIAQPHRLAAIMFTDIQGYTALMQQDEEKAVSVRNRHREVFNSVTDKFQGKILQYYGDGTLSIFQSAIDAVKCGIEMQRAFREAPLVPVRIGIHTGDIITTEEEIIGDGVNVASRIESLAVAGSVFISDKVYDEVKNQPGIQTVSMGSFEFKNVKRPFEVFAVANSGLMVPEKEQLTGKLKKRETAGWTSHIPWVAGLLITLIVLAGGYFLYQKAFFENPGAYAPDPALLDKSIAVLPFLNDSDDSTNVYLINGLMESILNNLQKVEDLRVISRTSVERYRHTPKLLPEIAQELGVRYFVEGSGQKIGNQIRLNIQLIDATTDRHLWSEEYNREAADIFRLQSEVAKKIADEIQVILTPAELQRIDEIPTVDLAAYDAFLQGRELFYQGTKAGLEQAIPHYEKAVELDPEFARAYAGLAIAYYFLDYDQMEKQYSAQINNYADKALLYDPQAPQSLVAKALFYLYHGDFDSALPHLEKALEYNPNDPLAINILADYYTRYVPDSEKYLAYALRGIRIDIASHDSTTASFIYLHVSNAFIQSGFVDEAERYINRSLDYDSDNLFSAYVKAFILYAKNGDLDRARNQLLVTLHRDTTRLDVLQELAKICYFQRDYEAAYRYYRQFAEARERYNLAIYPEENAKIATVMRKTGRTAEAEKFMRQFRTYTAQDASLYRPMNEALIAAYEGDTEKALEEIQRFSEADNFHYWILLFLELDPLMDEIKQLPAFQQTLREMERKFWRRHGEVRARLVAEGLLG